MDLSIQEKAFRDLFKLSSLFRASSDWIEESVLDKVLPPFHKISDYRSVLNVVSITREFVNSFFPIFKKKIFIIDEILLEDVTRTFHSWYIIIILMLYLIILNYVSFFIFNKLLSSTMQYFLVNFWASKWMFLL